MPQPDPDPGAGLIDALRRDHAALREVLLTAEPSLWVSSEATLAKVLLIASASYTEFRVQKCLGDVYTELAEQNPPLGRFVLNKAIARQFHTYFQWSGNNANQFLGLFGPEFKETATKRIAEQPAVEDGVRAFLELGRLRNELVHENFAAFILTKTADDIFALFHRSLAFLDALPELLRLGST